MNIYRGLAVLTLSILCSLHPAWGGGWESSGTAMQDPARPTTRAASAPHFQCRISVSYSTNSGVFEEFERTDELKPENFVAGTATIITDGLVDGKISKPFLMGQSLRLHVRDNIQKEGGEVYLTVSLTNHLRGGSGSAPVISSTEVRQDRTRPVISASIRTEIKKSMYSLKATCRDLDYVSQVPR